MSRVLIGDTCTVSSVGMCCLVNEALGIADVEVLSHVKRVVQAIEKYQPYLLILNITTMGVACFDIVECCKKLSPKTKILVFDTDFTGVFINRLWQLGVDGYCTSNAGRSELYSALKNVRQGKRHMCKTVSAHIIQRSLQQQSTPVHERFSWRELQIFLLMGTGKSSSEIAEILCISKQAVSTYKNRIFQKSNMKTPVEMARYINQHELCKADEPS